ncbi:hypothetical protein GXP71_01525 [Cellulomonas sp. H30R-01]|uniref:Uncharacterized protein n=1 Tax=Cellulomonas algicola TaxID=2071633 RepID=A0A401UVL1_9CELL|nr:MULTISPECIES: hypothetical protein [Cellulomonas]QHT54905.1 hypothetical protein GXP71_01525 [Cellulomonas sp. H30R-01]GCD18725.1 hypothetical protein CTKZ_02870 [Cellulomonas algicola]
MTARRRAARVALLVAIGLGVISPAQAAEGTTGDFTDVRAYWSTYGVTQEVQDELIEKFVRTGKVDALDGAAAPVATSTITRSGATERVETFNDGSIRVSSFEKPSSLGRTTGVKPLAATNLSGCSVTSGSGFVTYKNCLVSSGDGFRYMSFRATYEKYSGAYAKILSTGSPSTSSNYGTMTYPTRSLYRPNSTATQDAVAKYVSEWTSYNGASSETCYTSLWLTKSGQASVGTS